MLKKAVTALLVATGSLFGVGSASATVTYSFNWVGVGSFVYESPNFITGDTRVPVADLTSCSTSFGLCGPEYFYPGFSGHDDIEFGYDGGSVTADNYFVAGAFAQDGYYTEQVFGYPSSLTVSGAPTIVSPPPPPPPGEPVPEPRDLSLFGAGLAVVIALGRRKRQIP